MGNLYRASKTLRFYVRYLHIPRQVYLQADLGFQVQATILSFFQAFVTDLC